VVAQTKKDKVIRVNTDKCTGCRACEMACSAFHASPKYSIVNPARSRIRVFVNEAQAEYVPVYASDYTPAQCNGRQVHTIGGKEYTLCTFCGASCPSRELFKEPDSHLPLKCDMCESDPPLEKPMCVQVCEPGCLTYEETDVPVTTEVAEEKREEMEIGLESLVKKHGLKTVTEILAKIAKE
jgi:benzoyl-CoA reductase subunit BamC